MIDENGILTNGGVKPAEMHYVVLWQLQKILEKRLSTFVGNDQRETNRTPNIHRRRKLGSVTFSTANGKSAEGGGDPVILRSLVPKG